MRVSLYNSGHEPFVVNVGERIAQLVIQRVEEVSWQVVDTLDGHDRGGGFGHSGSD